MINDIIDFPNCAFVIEITTVYCHLADSIKLSYHLKTEFFDQKWSFPETWPVYHF